MNVLFLFDGYRRMDDRLRIDVHKRMREVCKFNIYGPNEHELDNSFAPIQYSNNISLKDVINKFKPDVLLMDLYRLGCYKWIDEELNNINIPTVIIEEDHYTKDGLYKFESDVLNWYKKCKFDLIIRRHYYKERQDLNTVWRPPSASPEIFYPVNIKNNKLLFAGSFQNAYYKVRRNAIDILSSNKLIDAFKRINDYPKILSEYAGLLACSGGYLHTPLTKTFESMLSGTALLCNNIEAKKILFGDKQCYFEYKDDCSNIIEQG